jgi:hypothetical protein
MAYKPVIQGNNYSPHTGPTFLLTVEDPVNNDFSYLLQNWAEYYFYMQEPGRSPHLTAAQRSLMHKKGGSFARAARSVRESVIPIMNRADAFALKHVGDKIADYWVDCQAYPNVPMEYLAVQARAQLEWERDYPVAAVAFHAEQLTYMAAAPHMLVAIGLPAGAGQVLLHWQIDGAPCWARMWARVQEVALLAVVNGNMQVNDVANVVSAATAAAHTSISVSCAAGLPLAAVKTAAAVAVAAAATLAAAPAALPAATVQALANAAARL